jgi:hypothetical protein
MNRPPTISGTPPISITVGSEYSFTPTAGDPDGDPLSFTISISPDWANFDAATGSLIGVPTTEDIGSDFGIVITVSDGTDQASLPAFDIEVKEIQQGTAALFWDPPSLNEDGSLLDDLAGFRVHYGTASGAYTVIADVPDPTALDFLIESLQPATYYFAVTSVDLRKNESTLSNEVSKVVQP